MASLRLIGPAMIGAGLAFLAVAVARGEAAVLLVVIVPVVAATGPLGIAGVLLTFVGFFMTFLFGIGEPMRIATQEKPAPSAAPSKPPPGRRWGGVVFLGPFPIVFGSDSHMTRTMLLLGVLLFLALLALTLVALLA